jgi:DNA-binding response OmpR family regulator
MDALNLLVTETVDQLVLDLSMPGLDGAETLEAIRACPGIQGLPVIVLTTERRGAAVAHIVNLGVSDFMLKPLHGARTRARMTAVMSQLLSSPD